MKRTHKRNEKRAILKRLYSELHKAKESFVNNDYLNIKRQIENIKAFY